MLIVLAVLVALVALAWPAIRKPLARQRLRSAAKEFRAEMVRTRIEAITTGQSLQIRFQPGTGCYRVEPWNSQRSPGDPMLLAGGLQREEDPLLLEETLSGGEDAAWQDLENSNVRPAVHVEDRALPREVVFAAMERPLDEQSGARQAGLQAQLTGAAGQPGIEEWSDPIVFHPNGRTSDAIVELVGEDDFRVSLALRGATGTVTVSALESPAAKANIDPLLESPTDAAEPFAEGEAGTAAPPKLLR
jgi:hypothetical protein